MRLSGITRDKIEEEAGDPFGDDGIPVGCVDFIVGCYGLRRFTSDIDAGRQYWREAAGIVSAALDWAATEGFSDYMLSHGVRRWPDVQAFRQRHIVAAIRGKAT